VDTESQLGFAYDSDAPLENDDDDIAERLNRANNANDYEDDDPLAYNLNTMQKQSNATLGGGEGNKKATYVVCLKYILFVVFVVNKQIWNI
jgi:hypothetical protein